MTRKIPNVSSVVVEREFSHSTEKIWRALTQPDLIQEWLMKNDFKAELGYSFSMGGDWGSVDCKVLDIETERKLSYTWEGMGIDTVVTWELTPTSKGTLLRMEQTGFKLDQERACQGAQYGWQSYFENLLQSLEKL